MDYSYLGPNDKVSKICFGCETLGGTDWGEVSLNDLAKAIEFAIDGGVNFFDTADVYGLGLSEQRLSEILGPKRHDLFIGTKVGVSWSGGHHERAKTTLNGSKAYTLKAVAESAKRLRMDAIPLIYSHWPDPKIPIEETFEALAELKEKGMVRHIGCSNYGLDQLKKATNITNISFLQLPINILSGGISKELEFFCRKTSIKIVSYNTLASGLLTGKFDRNSRFAENDRRHRLPMFQGDNFEKALAEVERLKIIARSKNSNLAQYAIRWALSQPMVCSAITGIKSSRQIKENIEIF